MSNSAKLRFEMISAIADRAISMAGVSGIKIDKLEMVMDLDFADRDCPIDFRKLAAAEDFDFAHDVFGIRRHLNRETKKIEDHFLPRCAA